MSRRAERKACCTDREAQRSRESGQFPAISPSRMSAERRRDNPKRFVCSGLERRFKRCDLSALRIQFSETKFLDIRKKLGGGAVRMIFGEAEKPPIGLWL